MRLIKEFAGILLVFLFISQSKPISAEELLNIHIERSVPKSQVKNIINADEDEPGGGNPTVDDETRIPGSPTNSTSKAGCLDTTFNSGGRSICCIQYTWPGYRANPQVLHPETPRNCSDVKLKDREAICFDPIVYAYSNTTTRPDPRIVSEICEADGHDCFCPGNTCITYVIYDNTDGEPRKNESHFCGTLRLTNTQKSLTSGCYQETKDGFIHEVCACNNEPFCNDSSISSISRTILFHSIILVVFVNFYFKSS